MSMSEGEVSKQTGNRLVFCNFMFFCMFGMWFRNFHSINVIITSLGQMRNIKLCRMFPSFEDVIESTQTSPPRNYDWRHQLPGVLDCLVVGGTW